MSQGAGDGDGEGKRPQRSRKSQAVAGSNGAGGTYRVGKNRPPVEHQFAKGGKPGPGRPKDSKGRTILDRLLGQKVAVGEDRLGRVVRKSWGEVIDYRLLKAAAEGDLRAIKLVKEFEYRYAELERRYGPAQPSHADVIKQVEEQIERDRSNAELSRGMVAVMNVVAQLKKLGYVAFVDGLPVVTDKATDQTPPS